MSRTLHPFLQPTALEAAMLRELVAVAETCYGRGWTAGTAGNFSLRVDPQVMWVSQSGVCKGELRWDRFIPLGLTENPHTLEALYRKPSDESALHAAIFRHFPRARAVVHVHPVAVIRASLRDNALSFNGLEMQKALGLKTHDTPLRIPLISNSQDIAGLARDLEFDHQVPLLVLRGHGVYAWASTPQQALNYVEGLDQLCATTDRNPYL